MKLLCTADIHIGRRASRLPHEATISQQQRFSAASAWEELVEYAVNHQVDVVLLAGDVVDRENRFFEAYGPLEAGLKRLANQGIQTIAVAGNHDVDVFPRLARAMKADEFRLLGQHGQWEDFSLMKDGQAVLRIYGWSFPEQYVRRSPLHSFPDELKDDNVPALGLLHGDLDQTNSHYGPMSRVELERQRCDFWLLGHIHQPQKHRLNNGSTVLYPGSPLALDPGEQGQHGPWLLEINGGTLSLGDQLPLSRTRYERIEISLDDIHDEPAFQTHVSREFSRQLSGRVAEPGNLEIISSRIRLTGRTKLHRRLNELAETLISDLRPQIYGITAAVEKVENATRPDIDLHTLAQETSPPGILARLIIETESGELSDSSRELFRQISRRLNEVHNARPYSALSADPPPAEQDAIAYFRQVGLDLLDALLFQKEER